MNRYEKIIIVKKFGKILKDFEPMVKNPLYLWNGREIQNFRLLPREAWGNWLICAVLRKMYKSDITFADSNGGDGFIVSKVNRETYPVEHVSALEIPKGDNLPTGEQRVINAINLKIDRGKKYAEGKILVVFFDGAGKYFRNKIRESIFGRHSFEMVFCVGLLCVSDEGDYSYAVTEFRDSFGERSVTHQVNISSDFTKWNVEQLKM